MKDFVEAGLYVLVVMVLIVGAFLLGYMRGERDSRDYACEWVTESRLECE